MNHLRIENFLQRIFVSELTGRTIYWVFVILPYYLNEVLCLSTIFLHMLSVSISKELWGKRWPLLTFILLSKDMKISKGFDLSLKKTSSKIQEPLWIQLYHYLRIISNVHSTISSWALVINVKNLGCQSFRQYRSLWPDLESP